MFCNTMSQPTSDFLLQKEMRGMAKAPVIGVTADFKNQKGSRSFAVLADGYVRAVKAAGGLPLILPSLDEESADQILDLLDGVVFTGGGDLDPRRDGFMVHPSQRLMEPRRETFERALMRGVVDRRMPVFGIGAGMQLLNVASGGNLFFHIPEDLPKALPHRDALDAAHRHGLVVEPGTLMDKIYGDGEIRVNSFHHMAIDEVAPLLKITARSPDEVVEAIESDTPDWFALGTQFHPEDESASALDMRLFEEFVWAIRAARGEEVVVSAAL